MSELLSHCQLLPVVKFEAGDIILPEGRMMGVIYILKEGQVEVVKRDVQVTLYDEPGSILGELSVLLNLPHMATVRAVKTSQ